MAVFGLSSARAENQTETAKGTTNSKMILILIAIRLEEERGGDLPHHVIPLTASVFCGSRSLITESQIVKAWPVVKALPRVDQSMRARSPSISKGGSDDRVFRNKQAHHASAAPAADVGRPQRVGG